jgi:hypothetical protein
VVLTNFQKFHLEDKARLESFFKAAGFRLCEYSFPIQFCWQDYNDSAWTIVDDMLVIRYVVDGQYRFVCPVGTGNRRRVVEKCFEYQAAAGSPLRIDFVPDVDGCHNEDIGPDDGCAPVAQRDPDNDDYIYLTAELADLPGKRFAGKRNHISALTRDHRWNVEKVDSATHTSLILDFVTRWAQLRGMDHDHQIALELEAVKRAIVFAPQLGLDIFLLNIDGAMAGISIGEKALPDTYVVHFEKSDVDVKGAYQALCSRVAAMVRDECMYIDREQDMGVEGLRKTKHSWNPVRMEQCWTVFPGNHQDGKQ